MLQTVQEEKDQTLEKMQKEVDDANKKAMQCDEKLRNRT